LTATISQGLRQQYLAHAVGECWHRATYEKCFPLDAAVKLPTDTLWAGETILAPLKVKKRGPEKVRRFKSYIESGCRGTKTRRKAQRREIQNYVDTAQISTEDGGEHVFPQQVPELLSAPFQVYSRQSGGAVTVDTFLSAGLDVEIDAAIVEDNGIDADDDIDGVEEDDLVLLIDNEEGLDEASVLTALSQETQGALKFLDALNLATLTPTTLSAP
jgi:hypothetical protein